MRHIWRRVAARFEVTDEEHVQGIRRTVAFYDRWRRPLLALYVAAAVAFAVMFVAAVSLLQGLVQWANMQGLIPGFVVGLALGMMLGGLTVHITHGLLFWLAPPLRTERIPPLRRAHRTGPGEVRGGPSQTSKQGRGD